MFVDFEGNRFGGKYLAKSFPNQDAFVYRSLLPCFAN